jgi:hypothetical protein
MSGDQPISAIANDPDFRYYATRECFWALQVDEMRRLSRRLGEARLYYKAEA